jgi:hypothetical protein
VFPTIGHEVLLTEKLVEKGLVEGLCSDVTKTPDEKLENLIEYFIKDVKKRKKNFEAAHRFNFTGGTERVAQKLVDYFDRNVCLEGFKIRL